MPPGPTRSGTRPKNRRRSYGAAQARPVGGPGPRPAHAAGGAGARCACGRGTGPLRGKPWAPGPRSHDWVAEGPPCTHPGAAGRQGRRSGPALREGPCHHGRVQQLWLQSELEILIQNPSDPTSSTAAGLARTDIRQVAGGTPAAVEAEPGIADIAAQQPDKPRRRRKAETIWRLHKGLRRGRACWPYCCCGGAPYCCCGGAPYCCCCCWPYCC